MCLNNGLKEGSFQHGERVGCHVAMLKTEEFETEEIRNKMEPPLSLFPPPPHTCSMTS